MSEQSLLRELSAESAAAERAGAWGDAAALHARIRDLFPDQERAWLGGARALGQDGRADEGDVVITEARARFPLSLPIGLEHVASATRRGQAEEAWHRAVTLAAEFPDHASAQAALCASLNADRRHDQANRVSADAVARLAPHLQLLAEHARAAEGLRDWPESHRRWQLLGAEFPDRADAPLGMALALREQRRFDEAEAILADALGRFPRHRQLLQAVALLSQVQRHWPHAADRWAAMLEHHPDVAAAHLGLVQALREDRRLEEAEAALALARGRLPASAGLATETAHLAGARGDWEGSIAAWEAVRAERPGSPQAVVEIGNILLQQKRFEEADRFLEAELERFAERPDVAMAHARVASRQSLWAKAQRRWSALEQRFPNDPHVLGGLAEALWALKEEEALVSILDRLLALRPTDMTAAILYARLEMRRNQAPAAVARLTAAQAASPNSVAIATTLGDARLQALLTEPPRPARAPSRAVPVRSAPRSLFEQFESLGSGCEFGLLQRKSGLEPLGLLRWGTISAKGLIDMLEQRFEGLGDPDSTSIRPVGGNYELHESRFRMSMQTFIATSTEAAETLLPKLCSRLRYLARELTEGMEEADRILVYKAASGITDGEIDRLCAAICAYGDNALLVVQLADDDHAAGSLEVLGDGLMLGFVSRFSNTDIDVDSWTSVCRAAAEAWAQTLNRRQVMSSLDAWI